jgi:hypothetical protein
MVIDQNDVQDNQETEPLFDFDTRLQNNLSTITSAILADPTLWNMVVHGEGLQRMLGSLALLGQKWHDEVVSENGRHPEVGEREVGVFHQYEAITYPIPYRSFGNPDMDSLKDRLMEQ